MRWCGSSSSGELAPGSLLPTEPEMSARFGVSRSVVREALRLVDAKGLIEVRHGSGTRVASPERWDPLDPAVLPGCARNGPSAAILRDLLEARTIIECEVAALAAERAEPAIRAALEAALVTMRDAPDDPAAVRRRRFGVSPRACCTRRATGCSNG